MKNNQKQTIFIIIGALIVLGLLHGIRQYRISDTDSSSLECELENGLCEEVVKSGSEKYLVPPSYLYDSGLTAEDVPAIDEPVFVSVNEADEFLADGVLGIDVEVGGAHRFYSFQILNWHHVVNDTFSGEELAITSCPLCRTGIVYSAGMEDATLTLETDGRIYNNNFLLTDRETDSLWSQLTGTAVSGDYIGESLETYPSEILSWEDWKNTYPNGEALSTETGYTRDYSAHPFGEYDNAAMIYFPLQEDLDDRIPPKWSVYVIEEDGEYLAFAGTVLSGFGIGNDSLGERAVAGMYNASNGSIRVFDRTVNEQELSFTYDFGTTLFTDEQTGSTWNANGLATAGSLRGTQLESLGGTESFWMCWSAMYPDTRVSTIDVIETEIESVNENEIEETEKDGE